MNRSGDEFIEMETNHAYENPRGCGLHYCPCNMNSNADQNYPNNPQGAQTDANGNATAPTVNDSNCGK
ncbi:hypothetical protein FJ434_26100 [Mesorhizobium sp. B2-5-13]|nr:hypothetical protein FJ432_24725 [Mesorhizobium sp. B2-6-5]TPJ76560.1 hypothetical protein FJ434_26100 [Mesorhizobium sp. B2-5-13]TPK42751.1 hypothetical protein FJ560_25765 [Mesorhizobium sp. B2-5-5]